MKDFNGEEFLPQRRKEREELQENCCLSQICKGFLLGFSFAPLR